MKNRSAISIFQVNEFPSAATGRPGLRLAGIEWKSADFSGMNPQRGFVLFLHYRFGYGCAELRQDICRHNGESVRLVLIAGFA